MDVRENNHYRHLLNQHKENREDILDDMENLKLGENDNNENSELSNYDNHPAELASELYDIEHQMALKKLHEHEIGEIERSLQKINKGTYGICEGCKYAHKPIQSFALNKHGFAEQNKFLIFWLGHKAP